MHDSHLKRAIKIVSIMEGGDCPSRSYVTKSQTLRKSGEREGLARERKGVESNKFMSYISLKIELKHNKKQNYITICFLFAP